MEFWRGPNEEARDGGFSPFSMVSQGQMTVGELIMILRELHRTQDRPIGNVIISILPVPRAHLCHRR